MRETVVGDYNPDDAEAEAIATELAEFLASLVGSEAPTPDEATVERYDSLLERANNAMDHINAVGQDVTVTFTPQEARRTLLALGTYARKTGLQAESGGEALDAAERLVAAVTA